MKKYEVPIVYRGQANYVIEANSPEEAARKAELMFKSGDSPDQLGNEWETIDHIGEVAEVGEGS